MRLSKSAPLVKLAALLLGCVVLISQVCLCRKRVQSPPDTLLRHAHPIYKNILFPWTVGYYWFTPNEIVVYQDYDYRLRLTARPIVAYFPNQKRLVTLSSASPEAVQFSASLATKYNAEATAYLPVIEWAALNAPYSKTLLLPVMSVKTQNSVCYAPCKTQITSNNFIVTFGSANPHFIVKMVNVLPPVPVPPHRQLLKYFRTLHGGVYLTGEEHLKRPYLSVYFPQCVRSLLLRLGLQVPAPLLSQTVYECWYYHAKTHTLQKLGQISSPTGDPPLPCGLFFWPTACHTP